MNWAEHVSFMWKLRNAYIFFGKLQRGDVGEQSVHGGINVVTTPEFCKEKLGYNCLCA
jgi:hypothetical protein